MGMYGQFLVMPCIWLLSLQPSVDSFRHSRCVFWLSHSQQNIATNKQKKILICRQSKVFVFVELSSVSRVSLSRKRMRHDTRFQRNTTENFFVKDFFKRSNLNYFSSSPNTPKLNAFSFTLSVFGYVQSKMVRENTFACWEKEFSDHLHPEMNLSKIEGFYQFYFGTITNDLHFSGSGFVLRNVPPFPNIV